MGIVGGSDGAGWGGGGLGVGSGGGGGGYSYGAIYRVGVLTGGRSDRSNLANLGSGSGSVKSGFD